MAVPQTKAELLKAIEVQFAKLMRELEKVPDDKYREPTLDAHTKGTTMSVGDLVAYLIGWGELVVKWIDRDQRGEPVDFPETGYKWNELGKLAQKFYGDSQALSASELLTRLRRSKKTLEAMIESRDDHALYGQPWYGKWTLGRMIQFNTSSPYANASGRLRKWKKAQGLG
ncbi:ClbS/DfsB family four-helix bundle protein [Ensifer adhaerens]|uniref:ClbS/DfsB family four-helix bundle protein n=1 Tax=Ensifer adhaerens TaxID=106592 RepID=UPI001CC0AB13|nr:ClbS/DfsB family four-helix bundle protein [Ensifer adhaerens]MBZ7921022.1 ClbS/DfsB family four-helix bundle protein [Ensifer adhaerens]UAX93468.1 ClbS/DfsB family four-helix bundle protein [Ensifer adhaerens]UAY01105.1 ClbS/DfsB family four-helix bundle protein [Ensifer adhaerens]UAY08486.1 ClbS/DfsB family four-helix bundle protein [Ensifer adhaerens]